MYKCVCVCEWQRRRRYQLPQLQKPGLSFMGNLNPALRWLVRYIRGHIPVKITLSTNYSICCLQPDLKIQIIRIAIHSKIKLVTEECMDFNRNSRQFFLYSWKADIYWKAAGFTGDWGWFSINSERCLHLEAELVGRKRNPIRHIHG